MPAGPSIPLVIKLVATAFVLVLMPVYWREYGPSNFLWFSDIALFGAVAAMWLESRLLASMMALAALALELAWNIDFLTRLVMGRAIFGMAEYMFDPSIPPFVRGLSLFHVALPVVLVWLVHRFGYDARALYAQTLLAWIVLPLTFALTDPEKNINWVFGPGAQPQKWMHPLLYLALLMIALPVCVYLPTHLLLRRLFASHW